MPDVPLVYRGVTIRQTSTTITESDVPRIVKTFHARVYQTKDVKRKNVPVEADSIEGIKQKIDAVLDA